MSTFLSGRIQLGILGLLLISKIRNLVEINNQTPELRTKCLHCRVLRILHLVITLLQGG